MSFNRTYLIFLTLVVITPTVITGLLLKSAGWTIFVFLLANVLVRFLQPVFHKLFRLVGDHSPSSRLNTMVRLILTQPTFEKSICNIYPGQEYTGLLDSALKIIEQLIVQAEDIDNKVRTEEEARISIAQKYPDLDQGNINWLNKGSRKFLKRKAKSLALGGYL